MKKKWTGDAVRQMFVDFFCKKCEHINVPSNSVIPHSDPTLLFTNAGMNQFKPIFLGQVDPKSPMAGWKRVANSQKCIRAGGKHNDLDDVGKDTYHHTFFEMLGNWSFGNYFKEDAIKWAWELLTDVYGLEKDRLYVSYFGGDEELKLPPDEDARKIWSKYLPDNRILPFGTKENFWEMGDTGPCGGCSEIHYDRIGNRDATKWVNADDPNVLEIWNLVFIEFNRESDGSLKKLPAQNVDTGMGFERITSILQDKDSNYDTDIFTSIFKTIQEKAKVREYTGKLGEEDKDGVDTAYRVIADHIRTLTVAISDGGVPDKIGRGYVLRRIVRRAARFARDFMPETKVGFVSTLVDSVVESLGGYFPGLTKNVENVKSIILKEEKLFERTLDNGKKEFLSVVAKCNKNNVKCISGEDAFKLYATFGFPIDLTILMAEEKKFTVDKEKFDACVEEHIRVSQKEKDVELKLVLESEQTSILQKKFPVTDDSVKYKWEDCTSKLLGILTSEKKFVETYGDTGTLTGLILDKTAFYAEEGGQTFDIGLIKGKDFEFNVTSVGIYAGYVLHCGTLTKGKMTCGTEVTGIPEFGTRKFTAANHTSTHVLNLSLRKVLEDKSKQRGSFVGPDRLRFDFDYKKSLSTPQIIMIEGICQDIIRQNLKVVDAVVEYEKAKDIKGLRHEFDNVYPKNVRVIGIGVDLSDVQKDPKNEKWAGFSMELCGGTHLVSTGEAVDFAIIKEQSISGGTRRIIAVTKDKALEAHKNAKMFQEKLEALKDVSDEKFAEARNELSREIKAAVLPLGPKTMMLENLKKLFKTRQKDIERKKLAVIFTTIDKLAEDIEAETPKRNFVVQVLKNMPQKVINRFIQQIEKRRGNKVPIFCLVVDEEKKNVLMRVSVPKSIQAKLSAKEWLDSAAGLCGGRGGGKAGMANGRGNDISKMDEVEKTICAFAEEKLK